MAMVVKPQGMPVQGDTVSLIPSDLLMPLALPIRSSSRVAVAVGMLPQ